MIKKSLITILAIFIIIGALAAEVELNDYNRSVPKSILIPSLKLGDFTYIDAEALAEALEIKTYREPVKRKLVLYLPKKHLKLTADNHFVMVNDQIFQLPAPVIQPEESIYIPLEPFLQKFGDLFPGSFVYHQGELNYSARLYNVLKLASTYDGAGVSLDILTSEKLQFTNEIDRDGKLALTIKNGKAEKNSFSGNILPQGVDSFKIIQFNGGAKLIFRFPPATMIDTVYAIDNPQGIRIRISGGKNITASSLDTIIDNTRERWHIDTVVIDPGHGGKDPGAIGPTGLKEKTVVLDIALRLEKLFKKKTNIKTVLTRRADVFIPLHERGKIANRNNGKLFVSIHCNASTDRRAKGCQVFFLSPARTKQALAVAELENAAVKFEEDQSLYQDLTDENYILLAMAQSQYTKESESLCTFIENKFSQKTNLKNRGVSQAGFYVLYGANMPAVLVETAFISNYYEEKLLKSKKFRQTMAEAIFLSIVKFRAEKEKAIR